MSPYLWLISWASIAQVLFMHILVSANSFYCKTWWTQIKTQSAQQTIFNRQLLRLEHIQKYKRVARIAEHSHHQLLVKAAQEVWSPVVSKVIFNRPSPATFSFIFVFSNKYMCKMSIYYTALGFEPTTFETWVSSHNH